MNFLDQSESGEEVPVDEVIPCYRQSFSLSPTDASTAAVWSQYQTTVLSADKHTAVIADLLIQSLALIPVGHVTATQVLQLLRRRTGPVGEEVLEVVSTSSTSAAPQKYGIIYTLPDRSDRLLLVKWTKEYAVHSAMYEDLCRQLLGSTEALQGKREVLLLHGKLLYSDPIEPLSILTSANAEAVEGTLLHRVLHANKSVVGGQPPPQPALTGLNETMQSALHQLPAEHQHHIAVLYATLQVDVNDFFTTKTLVTHLHQVVATHFSSSDQHAQTAEQTAAFDSVYDRWKRVTQVGLGNMYM